MMAAAADNHQSPVERVLDALRAVGGNPKVAGERQWLARCPVADRHKRGDRNPSLSVGTGAQGKALITCHGGCTWVMVAEALGLHKTDLFPASTVTQIGARQHTATYPYTDEHGALLFEVWRFREPDGGKTFRQRAADGSWSTAGIRKPLYNLPAVLAAKAEGRVILLPEGEKDAENATRAWAHLGGVGTCNPGGAGKWRPEHTETLRGAHVVIIADNDTVGRGHADEVMIHLTGVAASVRYLLPAAPHKDLSDHLKAGLGIDELVPMRDELPPEDVAEGEDDDDWSPLNVADVARRMEAGEWDPVVPTVLAVGGSVPLFYGGRINSLFGESGGGKTWIALLAVLEQLRLGRRVLVIDYEDTIAGIAERLLLLGATIAEIELLDYVSPATSIEYGLQRAEAHADVYSLVVLDSTGEAMAAGGIDTNSDPETARWFTLLKRLMRATGGPAMLILDHVPKATDAPTSYAIGSQRKRAAITGASYRVDTLKPFSKGRSGRLKLVVAKDRFGARSAPSTAAIVDVDAEGEGLTFLLHLSDAQEAEAKGERFRPTVLMERVSRWLEVNPRQPKSVVLRAVTGKAEHLRSALDVLIEEGWIEVVTGERNTLPCVVRTAFRDGMAAPGSVDNSGSGTTNTPGGDLGPAMSQGGPRTYVPRSPSPTGDLGVGRISGLPPTSPASAPVDNFVDPWKDF
jgi:hypothetical protein